MADKVTWMVLKVDLHCPNCYKKIKKILCKFPAKDQVYDEKKKEVRITVVCCSPEKIKAKLLCKGGKLIISIDILPPPKPDSKPPPKPEDKPTPQPPPSQPPKIPVPVIPVLVVPVKPVLGGFCCPHGIGGRRGCDSCNHGCDGCGCEPCNDAWDRRRCDPCNHGCGMPVTPRPSCDNYYYCNGYTISESGSYVSSWEDYCSQENTGACRIV